VVKLSKAKLLRTPEISVVPEKAGLNLALTGKSKFCCPVAKAKRLTKGLIIVLG